MKTCGYDMLLELDEKLLNKALAVVFYSGKLKMSGSYAFVDGIPDELHGFTKVEYRIRLKNEPYVDLRGENLVYLRLSVELFLTVLSGIEIELDVDFRALATVRLDMSRKVIIYDLSVAQISDIMIGNKLKVNKKALFRLNDIIKIVLSKFITQDLKEIEIPMVMVHIELPEMPEGEAYTLPVKFADIKILDSRLLVIGILFFDHIGGNSSQISDFTSGSEFFVAIKEDVCKKIFDFWWDHKTLQLKQTFDGEFPVTFKEKVGKAGDVITRMVTLGFIETVSEVKSAVLKYQGSVEVLEKPEFDFTDQGKAIIKKMKLKAILSSRIDAFVKKKISLDTSSFIPDTVTPWEDDKVLKEVEKNREFLPIHEEAILELTDVTGVVTVNQDSNLVVKPDQADLNLTLGKKWYQNLSEKLINHLLNLLENNIVRHIPGLVISPSLVTSKCNLFGYTFGLLLKDVLFENNELIVKSDIKINELKSEGVTFPLYIASKISKRLHRFDCPSIEDIHFGDRIGFHLYDEAVRAGYIPCGLCIRK